MIKEVCHKLKEKRCSLGYSIEYTVEKTKLHPSAIKDIEAGNLTNISPVYLKGFMKIYASFLDVDLGTSLEEINSFSQPNKKTMFIRKTLPTKPNQETKYQSVLISPELKKKILFIVLGLVLLWVLVVVGSKIIGGIAKIFKSKPKQTTTLTEDVATPLVTKGELLVSLTVKRKCFLRVIVDGTLYFDGLLAKGARESWKGKKEIELKISDGSAVYLEVNGKPIPTLTSQRRKPIKSLKITPSGISVDK